MKWSISTRACLTALTYRTDADVQQLLPYGFVQGVLAIMLTSLIFSVAV